MPEEDVVLLDVVLVVLELVVLEVVVLEVVVLEPVVLEFVVLEFVLEDVEVLLFDDASPEPPLDPPPQAANVNKERKTNGLVRLCRLGIYIAPIVMYPLTIKLFMPNWVENRRRKGRYSI